VGERVDRRGRHKEKNDQMGNEGNLGQERGVRSRVSSGDLVRWVLWTWRMANRGGKLCLAWWRLVREIVRKTRFAPRTKFDSKIVRKLGV